METVSVGVPVFKSKIKEHDQLKKLVLNAMDDSKDGYLKDFDTKDDLIHKLDYDNSADFNRPWVKIIGNSVQEELNSMATSVGYIKASYTIFGINLIIKMVGTDGILMVQTTLGYTI